MNYLALALVLALPTIHKPTRYIKPTHTAKGAELLMSKPGVTKQPLVIIPSRAYYLPFRYAPGSTNNAQGYNLESSTNMHDWVIEQYNVQTNTPTVINGGEPKKFFRIRVW